MESPHNSLRIVIWLVSLQAILHLASAATLGNETDRLALIAFKEGITDDPLGVLSSWNNTVHFCEWGGVLCSRRHQRVVVLDLHAHGLVGSVSPYIANLTFLRKIRLGTNKFHGEIPQEIGRLFRLRHLNLTENSFGGVIPANLSQCSNLRLLALYDNELVGQIPIELASLSRLEALILGQNHLMGPIPASLANLSSLTQLAVSENSLEGNIPDDLGRLSKLQVFQLAVNNLSGPIPPSLYNLSSIWYFVVTDNQLHGSLPADIGFTLPNLEAFLIGKNSFTGKIPESITNASRMELLFLSRNSFSGSGPSNIGSLQALQILNVGHNQLGSSDADDQNFLTSVTNCSKLEVLALDHNHFRGVFPNSISNLTQLQQLLVGRNMISGSIPAGVENLINLTLLATEENLLTGRLPIGIGKLPYLQVVSLFGNKISGEIPSSLGNITMLSELHIDENDLQGSIPSSLGNCRSLQVLDLSDNNLTGRIPKELASLSSLSLYVDMARNSLTGSVPPEVGSLINLGALDLSENKLSGKIPSTMGDCVSLKSLYLSDNFFEGTIPPSLIALRAIQDLDLSLNNLSGQIPKYLEKFLFLQNLNFSFNDFEGEVPKEGAFKNASLISVIGNNKLCGGISKLHLPPCVIRGLKKRRRKPSLKIIIPIVSICLCLSSVSCFFAILYWKRKQRKKPSSTSSLKERHLKVSYAQLFRATNMYSSANLIGVGSYGSVYKGILEDDQTVVAVKVLNLQLQGASKSFIAECEALRNIRHRNLIRILTSCSSLDFKGNDFKALVFEFMPNGSLEKWLHQHKDEANQSQNLNLVRRLNIAIDVASAMDYLHNHCETPVVHCDLKPSNILLDDDMTAHVTDFGLARLLSVNDPSQNRTSSVAIKGSIGYIAPEYSMSNQVSTYGDIYSFGILLLEMFTGKRPVDDMFRDGLNLHKFVSMALPDQVMKITDPLLVTEEEVEDQEEEEEEEDEEGRVHECLVSIFEIGISCSTESPTGRMEMRDVVRKMHEIKELYDKKLDP